MEIYVANIISIIGIPYIINFPSKSTEKKEYKRYEIDKGIATNNKNEKMNKTKEGIVKCKDNNKLFFIDLKGGKLSISIEGDTKQRKGAKKNPISIKIG